MWRRRNRGVPEQLVQQIDEALGAVDAASGRLSSTRAAGASIGERQRAHRELRAAFAAADTLLRQAVAAARGEKFPVRSYWRERLSRLDAARQQQLFAEQDDFGVLSVGSIQMVDYGMTGPDLGDPLHGSAVPRGTPARIGVDMTAALSFMDSAPTLLPALPRARRLGELVPSRVERAKELPSAETGAA